MSLLLLLAATAVLQQPARPLETCRVPGLETLTTLCATVQVRENRALPNGRRLDIRVVVIPPDSGAETLMPAMTEVSWRSAMAVILSSKDETWRQATCVPLRAARPGNASESSTFVERLRTSPSVP